MRFDELGKPGDDVGRVVEHALVCVEREVGEQDGSRTMSGRESLCDRGRDRGRARSPRTGHRDEVTGPRPNGARDGRGAGDAAGDRSCHAVERGDQVFDAEVTGKHGSRAERVPVPDHSWVGDDEDRHPRATRLVQQVAVDRRETAIDEQRRERPA